MAFSLSLLSFLGVVALLVLRQIVSTIQFKRKYKLPAPLPGGYPFIGNAMEVPLPMGMWAVDKARKYGEMFTVSLGGKNMVFLNSKRVVIDLLEKRATIYSSRPFRPMAQGVASGDCRMLMMPYGERWRSQRKIMHSLLNSVQAESQFAPLQERESKDLVWDLLQTPERFHTCIQRFSNSVVMSVIMGRRTEFGDHQLTKMLSTVDEVTKLIFKPSLNSAPDLFVWLRHLPKPLQWWRPYGEDLLARTLKIFQEEVDTVQAKIANGTVKPCFATALLEGTAKKEYILTETEKLMVFSTLLEAGSDTSRTATTQMIAGAAAFPEWAVKARALLDEVCGANAERLPTLGDREALPYITAAVKEALRWRPFLQTGVPHMLTEDDEYEGYKFPAGTLFTWNAYALALNENDYSDAERFKPERFMNEDLKNPLKGHWSFGTGRRVCPGFNVGFNNVWIATACMLYCFDIEQDPNHPIDTFNSLWDSVEELPFHVKITPRSPAHAELIKRLHEAEKSSDY